METSWTEPAIGLPGFGRTRPGALKSLGIETVGDLLHHLPRRHEDRRKFKPIASILEGEIAIVHGSVHSAKLQRLRGRKSYVDLVICDDSGSLKARWWNQPWIAKWLPPGTELVLFGKVKGQTLVNPEYEAVRESDPLHVGRIVPVYPLAKGVTGPALRRAVFNALKEAGREIEDPLPEALLKARGIVSLEQALHDVHFPESLKALEAAKERLRYEELFFFQLAVGLRRMTIRRAEGIAHKWSREVDRHIRARFPFRFTRAQDRAALEILADLRAKEPMNRLLQGDVGSGKTAVALYAALVSVANRYQAAFLAPTELLARQHVATVKAMLSSSDVTVELLVGATTPADRREILRRLAAGEIDLVVGTHALLEPGVEFSRLGLVLVDEQHKFGVEQRAALVRKGVRPDVLVLTATPIPRTLALTAFGDLDVSIVDELPPGRMPAETRVLPAARAQPAYERVRSEAAAGRQSYVVFPLVAESEEVDAKAAEEGFAELRENALAGLRLGLVTGRTPSAEREKTMGAFREGRLDVLVGTTVLEVGVDVPNATVMVVESAERFGLSTLHQLRGRIGRGRARAFCYLVASRFTEEAKTRLRIMEETQDGFRIAEEDLRLRGPGEFFGTRQHGLPEFRVADLVRDHAVLEAARQDAFALLSKDPRLEGHPRLGEEFRRRFRGRLGLYGL